MFLKISLALVAPRETALKEEDEASVDNKPKRDTFRKFYVTYTMGDALEGKVNVFYLM